ncbi:DNA-directed RNA polymerase II subunit RPB7 [Entomortierella chlamydospora]|nr:DNA-directed RNA polymerase II subunit RPB7 [Entomortierella chlamydospora]
MSLDSQSQESFGNESISIENASSTFRYPQSEGWTRSTDPIVSKRLSWRNERASGGIEGKEMAAASIRHYGHSGNNMNMDRKSSQRLLPPRLTHDRPQSANVHLASLSPVPNNTIPSPLASPITATANSLTALSISQTSAHSAFSGRDLSKITIPRERRKSRPYSISSAESLLVQERGRADRDDDLHQDQSGGGLSDPETSRRNGLGTKPTAKNGKSAEMKSPSLKPASQLRVNLYNLVSTGYLPVDTLVVFREHSATVTAKGTLIPQIKEPNAATLYPWLQSEYETPSAWATAMVKGGRTGKVAVNGWSAIKIPLHQLPEIGKMVEGQGLTEVSLDLLRKRYLADLTEDGSTQTESSSTQTNSLKGSSVLDRKKRKRHVTASVDTIGLRITTQTNTGDQKGRSATMRPRKRTMSDVSGMVGSDLLQDRQLHLEAAGALFSMQDRSLSPTFDTPSRRGAKSQGTRQKAQRHKHRILLESLARHRQEQESVWPHLSPMQSSLRAVKVMSLVPGIIPLDPSSSVSHLEFCVLCGASGQVAGSRRRSSAQSMTSHHWSSVDSTEATFDQDSYEQDAMKRCFDCGECYHIDCIPTDTTNSRLSPSPSEEPWRCPRCNVCSCCQKSIHEAPSSQPKSSVDSKEILVLSCCKCCQFTHLQCQLTHEPTLKGLNRSNAVNEKVEWACFSCRKCVECGYRVQVETQVENSEGRSINNSKSKDQSKVEGRWSNGSALCPACTVLAEKGNICPLCCRVYQDDDYETPMIFCDGCSLWVHVACDKGLQDRDYEELGEDSRQYFCPSCIPTPIPSPAHSSSSSSLISAVNSVEQSPWQGPYSHSRDSSSVTDEDWNHRGRRKKDDILDLIKAAKEISDSESQADSPYNSYSPMFPSNHSRTMSASLESVAEVAAAEALLTIFSGANTPVNSTPYTSYPPSPYEPSFNSMYERRYPVINSPQESPLLTRSMAFTPLPSGQESSTCSTFGCQGEASCQCYRNDGNFSEDYFNSREYPRPTVSYHQIGQEFNVSSENPERPEQLGLTESSRDVIMEETGVGVEQEQMKQGRDANTSMQQPLAKSDPQSSLYQPFSPQYRPLQESMLTEVTPIDESLQKSVDTRECLLCRNRSGSNRGAPCKESQLGRLLPIKWTSNEAGEGLESLSFGWIHSQCALWSSGVTIDSNTGGMSGVGSVVGQCWNTICSACGQPGASIKCKAAASRISDASYACTAVFHYPCLNHHRPSQALHQDPLHQHTNANNAVVMDQKQRTILCSMHYREVSTLNDLRTAAFALQSSVMPANSFAKVPQVRPGISTPGSMKPWSGPIWIKDSLFEDSLSRASIPLTNRIEDHDTKAKSNQEYHLRKGRSSESFRIGGLVIHSIGNFDPPRPVHCETGLGNDIDLDHKYNPGLQKEKKNLQSEVLALPLGFKCERQLLLEGSIKYSVVAEVVLHRFNGDSQSDAEMVDAPVSMSGPLDGAQDHENMCPAWKITVNALGSNPNATMRDCVFYSDSINDVIETLFLSSDTECPEDKSRLRQNKLYLQSPSTFFGLDHPVVRRMILSLKGEKEAASRMWLRYREDQKALERQCRKHGCFSNVSSGRTLSKHEHSLEHIESIGAARARSRPRSQLMRKRVVRVGIALSHGGQRIRQSMAVGDLPMPGLMQDFSKYIVTATTPQKEPHPNGVSSKSDITVKQLQKLHAEQPNNVALYWNGRKVTTIATAPHAQPPVHRKDPTNSVCCYGESSKDDVAASDLTDMEVDCIGGNISENTILNDAESSLPIHADMRVYATRAYQQDEMIMEYVGEVIGPAVAIRRQAAYQKQGRGCYMMWCDLHEVVIDATIQGGLARHIRRDDLGLGSVYAKTVVTSPPSSSQSPKVVICAAKNLLAGDELTMKYCS